MIWEVCPWGHNTLAVYLYEPARYSTLDAWLEAHDAEVGEDLRYAEACVIHSDERLCNDP